MSRLMGSIPRDRVVPDCSGVDLCGPFMIRYRNQRKGENQEIERLLKLIKIPDDKLSGFLSTEGIEWKFIPPTASTFCGLWEVAVKSVKYHLKRVVGKLNLTYEEFLTVCIEIEGVLNSRPLCPLTSNIDDLNVLTPAHFLVGRPINCIIEPKLIYLNENALKRWQRVARLVHRSFGINGTVAT
ncbi:integrase catalytic domain-containing protein [Trichonephila clavipes]|nr:integrase catalytic domain-containing protein [Trichonephila clavipes]